MKYRILKATNTFDGTVTWRVQYKFLCFWCYVTNYDDPYEFETREGAEEYIGKEMKNDAKRIVKVIDTFQYAE